MLAPPHTVGRFRLVLVKPSHYDDDGYVIQWLRSPIPANSLACLYGLAAECAEKRVLGADIAIDIDAIDEANRRVRPEAIARDIRAAGSGMVMLVGVQSNQFPRALDLTRTFRKLGVTVGIGGFHVSGTLSMLPKIDAEVQKALDLGAFVFAGEAEEGRLEEVLTDAANDRLKPIYNFMADLPGIERVPIPHLPADVVRRTYGANTSFDAGRGCPFQCSFCTIINVQGRKSRRRSADDVERIVMANAERGIRRFFITDDNFARNKDWELIFDRLIEIRETRGVDLSLIIQVDTLCHKHPNFIDKAARAGVRRVFIGLENISPDNLAAAKKKQNKITEYRKMLLAWKSAGVITYCGYILGFPNDTPERIERDIKTAQRELPIDLLEFFFLTPLPGSEDHKKLFEKGVWMDPDLNKYDLNHAVTGHPADVEGGMGADLLEGVGDLLFRRACRARDAPRGGDRKQSRQGALRPELVHRLDQDRAPASAGDRLRPHEAPPRPPFRHAHRARAHLLPALPDGDTRQSAALAVAVGPDVSALQGDQARSRAAQLHGSGADAGRGRRERAPRHVPDRRGAGLRRAGAAARQGPRRRRLAHDPERWEPVFGRDRAPKSESLHSDSIRLEKALAAI